MTKQSDLEKLTQTAIQKVDLTNREQLFIALINNICSNNYLNTTLIPILKNDLFTKDFAFAFDEIIKRQSNQQAMPTTDYMNHKFGIDFDSVNENYNYFNQDDLFNYIVNLHANETLNHTLIDFESAIANGSESAINKLIANLQLISVNSSTVKVLDFERDFDKILEQQSELETAGDIIKVGLGGFDDINIKRSYLVGILLGSGGGKSYALQKHNALAIKAGYKTLHVSLELKSAVFWSRFWTQLEWLPSDYFFADVRAGQTPKYTKEEQIKYTTKLRKLLKENNSTFQLSTLDQEKSSFTVAKIEKLLKQYRPDILYLDYIQLLDEDFDPVNSTVAQRLKDLAVIYDCAIIMAVQTNSEGTAFQEVPYSSHIARCKKIYDACDDFIAGKSRTTFDPSIVTIEFLSRKARHGCFVHFSQKVNMKTGEWQKMDLDDLNSD